MTKEWLLASRTTPEKTYPVVTRQRLKIVPKPGLFKRRVREQAELPYTEAHHASVYLVDGVLVVDRGERSPRHGDVVRATHVTVVDLSHEVPIPVQFMLPTGDGGEFAVVITFSCTVKDAVQVVEDNRAAATALDAYLRGFHRLFELARLNSSLELNEARTNITAHVVAYTLDSPPIIRGLEVKMTSVEVITPEVYRERAKAGLEHALALDKQAQAEEIARKEQEREIAAKSLDEQRRIREVENLRRLVGDSVTPADMALIIGLVLGDITADNLGEHLAKREEALRLSADEKIKRTDEAAAQQAERDWDLRLKQWEADRDRTGALLTAKIELIRRLAERGALDFVNVLPIIAEVLDMPVDELRQIAIPERDAGLALATGSDSDTAEGGTVNSDSGGEDSFVEVDEADDPDVREEDDD